MECFWVKAVAPTKRKNKRHLQVLKGTRPTAAVRKIRLIVKDSKHVVIISECTNSATAIRNALENARHVHQKPHVAVEGCPLVISALDIETHDLDLSRYSRIIVVRRVTTGSAPNDLSDRMLELLRHATYFPTITGRFPQKTITQLLITDVASDL
jgi:hypothetical protein